MICRAVHLGSAAFFLPGQFVTGGCAERTKNELLYRSQI
ncbi:putative lipoprotein [Klebsiella pneumoniae UHKPC81]|nr:putative lipoprotein [Klebsiella pneumoniae UHKPC81]